MKRILCLLLLILLVKALPAQTTNEWIRQKKTQRKYLLQQIAKLQIYLGYVKKGYAIANEGLRFIGDLKNGDLLLHAGYFAGLQTVKPAVRDHPHTQAVLALYRRIQQHYNEYSAQLAAATNLTEQESRYCAQVTGAMMQDLLLRLEATHHLLTDNDLEMTDDRRLSLIADIYRNVEQQYHVLQGFCERTTVLIRQRQHELQQLHSLKQLFEP